MTVTIEVKPEIARHWQEIAAREGSALETLLVEVKEERAAALDAEDLAEARRVLADTSEPDVSWEEIKRASTRTRKNNA